MKWDDMTTVQKIIYVIGWIGGLSYFILTTCEIFDLFSIPKAITFPLFSAFWVCMGMTQSDKKLAKWYYVLAAGYVLLTLLYIFF